MGKFVFINRFFYPDHSATSQLLSDLAFDINGTGAEVQVVTSRMCSGQIGAVLPAFEEIDGLSVHRILTTDLGRNSLLGRACDYTSFYGGAIAKLHSAVKADDVVIAKTDPPLMSAVAALICQKSGARLVNWVQDLYPEVAVELGVSALQGLGGKLLSQARNASFKAAAVNVAIGELMAERIRALGLADELVRIIPNWSDDQRISPIVAQANSLRREWGLDGKFVIGYSGNLGRAHEARTLLGAAERLKGRGEFCFLFIGGGHHYREIESEVIKRGLKSFLFMPYQPRERLAESLCAADVHWISLRPELEGLIVPSKFYSIAAAGRPIITVGGRNGELARLVAKHGCGAVIGPGEVENFAEKIAEFADHSRIREACGRRAREMLDKHFSREFSLAKWRNLLIEIANF